MTQPENTPNYLELIRERGSGALDKKMGIEILEASPDRLVGRMPVEGNTQPIGLLHGGANVVLAESLGSIGTQLHAGPNRSRFSMTDRVLIVDTSWDVSSRKRQKST